MAVSIRCMPDEEFEALKQAEIEKQEILNQNRTASEANMSETGELTLNRMTRCVSCLGSGSSRDGRTAVVEFAAGRRCGNIPVQG